MDDAAFLKRVEELAAEYDKERGSWEEPKWVGQSFYNFCCDKLSHPVEKSNETYPN